MKKKPTADDAADAKAPKRRRINGKQPFGLPMTLGHSTPSMGWINLAARAGLNSAQARLWQLLQLPPVLMMMCVIANAVEAPSVLCVEYFAGVGAIAQGFVDAGFAALTYDKFHLEPDDADAQQDLNNRSGWMTALCCVMNLDPGGLCWLGTVCSSWVVVSRGSTGRSPAFVLGDQRHFTVQQANIMAIRSALLCMICYVRGIAFILEQPSSSLMLDLPAWRWIERVAGRVQGWGFQQQRTCLGAFGATRPKQVLFTSNREWVTRLYRSSAGLQFPSCEEAGVVRVYIDTHGQKKFVGGDKLKETQEYPKQLGTVVQQVWAEEDVHEFEQHMDAVYNVSHLKTAVQSIDPQWHLADLHL